MSQWTFCPGTKCLSGVLLLAPPSQPDINILRPDIDILRPDIDILRPDINILRPDINILRPDIDILRPDIDILRPDIDILRPDIDILRPDIDILRLVLHWPPKLQLLQHPRPLRSSGMQRGPALTPSPSHPPSSRGRNWWKRIPFHPV